MIVSSQVDWFCWTQRVGFACRDCREALTAVTLEEPPGLETCSGVSAVGRNYMLPFPDEYRPPESGEAAN
jgi:hypothetical protein